MYLFCCAKYYMLGGMYNPLVDLVVVIKGTVVNMKQSVGDICNSGNYPPNLGFI